jgi:DNA processing protein
MMTAVIGQEEELLWLALRMTPQMGARRAVELVERFGGPAAIFRLEAWELEANGLSGSVARSIEAGTAMDDALEQQRLLRAQGVQIITINDEAYPPLLKQIYDPPLLLYARGRVELLADPMVAVVGTRRPTPYGMSVAERMSKDLAESGLVIASGMARGIDTAAHKAALAVQGKTIAVLGCGVDVVYPAENKRLAEQMVRDGLLLSEFPLRTPGYPQNFPIRNRIVSGMSYGVLIVEGAQYSGSAITARLALDQGREVFAVPGSIMSKQSWGPNLLIRQGARLVQGAEDVLCDLPPQARMSLQTKSRQRLLDEFHGQGQFGGQTLNEMEHPMAALKAQVLRRLSFDESLNLDQMIELMNQEGSGVSASELIAALFELELEGSVKQLPGKNYIKSWQ